MFLRDWEGFGDLTAGLFTAFHFPLPVYYSARFGLFPVLHIIYIFVEAVSVYNAPC